MKTLHIILKIILSLILIMPIFGVLGVFPAPTADMYTNSAAFAFIQILMTTKYIMVLEALVFIFALVCLWAKREFLAGLVLLPLTVNIVGFHAFLDGGIFAIGAVMANVLALLNIYFLWKHKTKFSTLFARD